MVGDCYGVFACTAAIRKAVVGGYVERNELLPAATVTNPLHATLWRKLLAVRVFLLCVAGLILTYFLVAWADAAKLELPKWLGTVLGFLALLPFFAFISAVKEGASDLVVHFVPEGRFKRLLLWGISDHRNQSLPSSAKPATRSHSYHFSYRLPWLE